MDVRWAAGFHSREVLFSLRHFTWLQIDLETYYLACLFHDIGTASKFLTTTKLSFEFKGAILARDLILQLGGAEDQADSVCDAIIRHQDLFVKGYANSSMIFISRSYLANGEQG